MSTGELLSIEPLELKFPFELKKQISCSLQLSNKTDNYVAFKVKTTNPKKYCVRPNTGIVLPRSTCDIIVTMQAQREAPPDMQCKDKFLLQSVATYSGATPKDINSEMFSKEAGHVVEECKLRVIYVAPPQPPSPVPEGSEEDSSPRASLSENGNSNGAEFATVTKAFVVPQEKTAEACLQAGPISRCILECLDFLDFVSSFLLLELCNFLGLLVCFPWSCSSFFLLLHCLHDKCVVGKPIDLTVAFEMKFLMLLLHLYIDMESSFCA